MTRLEALEAFYDLLARLRDRVGGERLLRNATARSGWPQQGVYFFFEDGEFRQNGQALRVVRAGTHALKAGGRANLWNRLRQHRGNNRGARAGGGNHRGSVFRLHVGTALLARGGYPRAIHDTWAVGANADGPTQDRELPLERDVSTQIGDMPFLWVGVLGPPGPGSERGAIETGAIALLSNSGRPAIDPPSARWLGHHAANPRIRQSGLWNVNHVERPWSTSFLPLLESWIGRM